MLRKWKGKIEVIATVPVQIKEDMPLAYTTGLAHRNKRQGTLADAIAMVGSDVFIGVSASGTETQDMVRSMAGTPIIFACANQTP